MKKIITFAKKHDNLIIFIILLMIISGNTYFLYINNNDELINFLNIYKMINGLTIYKDTNVIITPLFFYIGKILLSIFGTNIFIFRTYNLLTSTILYFLVYKILRELKLKKNMAFFFTIMITVFTYTIVGGGANYNVVSYSLFELGLLLLLKMKKGNKKDICQGIVFFLIFFSSQKLAAGYFLALLVYNITNKNIKSLIKELIVSVILLLIYLLYLYTQNNLYNFINYTILGIGEFKNKNTNIDKAITEDIVYVLVSILTISIYMIMIKIKKNEEDAKILKTLMYFSIGALIIVIPIFNYYHIVLANIIMLISLVYIINYLIEPLIEGKTIYRVINIITLILILCAITKSIINIIAYKENLKEPIYQPFYGAIIEEDLKNEIDKVSEYIKNNDKNTIVLSTYAPFYSIKLNDLDNKVYDWALRGNLGKDGEEGLIEQIKQLENTQILLYNSDDKESEIYQFVYKAADYIKENMKYIGKIEKFDVYQTVN